MSASKCGQRAAKRGEIGTQTDLQSLDSPPSEIERINSRRSGVLCRPSLAAAFLEQLKVEFAQTTGSVNIPGTAGQPEGQQQLFYASVTQQNMPWLNQGLANPAITGLIVRIPIQSQSTGGGAGAGRDPLTGMPLDSSGRYTVRVEVGNPQSGYEVFQPQYFSCATQACLQSGANLDISDPGTIAYVRALDAQVFKDIGLGATVGSLVTPLGVEGAALATLGLLSSGGQVANSGKPFDTARDEALLALSEMSGEAFLRDLLGHTPGVAARVTALVNLAGGWDAFVNRVKIDLLEIKPNETKK